MDSSIMKLAVSGLSIEKVIVAGFVAGCIALVFFFVREWFRKNDTAKMREQLASILTSIQTMKESIARIEGRMDSMGRTVQTNHDELIRAKMEVKALWRAVDPPNRKSDNGGNGP